ncbi:carrier superfamily protein [Acanthamoeba castellanii str. Neff]|uniref:Carrier superfamily protein n=1 Tax=Acanthamoeba castellanii (strain ATCC 30010 / Neff) TaxID=1257118 RepID=L8HDG0_ACACF|nr:carrier superfamily protein [Acanthamoeba castellanii str. Neff]ELR23554.1 carrier superfamily protein [Acanthamoeba castellanii str. Neff]
MVSCAAPLPVVNPIEVIKTRLQLQGELQEEKAKSGLSRIYGKERKYKGFMHGGVQILRDEGIAGLYKGIVPAALRECSYAAIRLALYDPIKTLLGENRADGVKDGGLPFWKKLVAGATAGSIGAAIATPTDVLKVRMQAEGARDKPRYKNTLEGFVTIARTEGIRGLYKGVVPTTQRACILSAAMMSSYDHSKHFILQKGWIKHDNLYAHICAGMMAGFSMAVVSTPIDVVKTRIMNRSAGGPAPYRGMFDCLVKTAQAEGVLGLYKGFVPTFLRLGPHTILAFTIYEELRKWAGIRPV